MDIEARVAVLEQIARETAAALAEIRNDLRDIRNRQHTDFLWLISFQIAGFAALLGVMAHGFHWI